MINFYQKDTIGYIEISSPPGNSIDQKYFDAFNLIIEEISSNNQLKGMIIFGSGRHFSEGSDIETLLNLSQNASSGIFNKNLQILQKIKQLTIPSVAILKGICLGSGLEIALHCDFRFAISKCTIGLPETSFDLIPGLGGITLLQKKLNLSDTFEFILKDKNLNGEEALKIGIVDYISTKKTIIFEAELFIQSIKNGYQRFLNDVYLDRYKKIAVEKYD